MMDRSSFSLSDSTLIQSEEKLKTGSVLPGLSLEAASFTISGVTLTTSWRLNSPRPNSTSVLSLAIFSASSTEL